MKVADVKANYDLLYQYFAGNAQPVSLKDGLSLEVKKPTLRGVIVKENTSLEFLWKLISLGQCWLFRVKNSEGATVHQSMMIGWNPKFSFLKKYEYEIGPCYTIENYRGLGIYPYVLQQIVSFLPNNRIFKSAYVRHVPYFYMFVSPDNISSCRGVEKAGFKVIGLVQRKRFGLWKRVE